MSDRDLLRIEELLIDRALGELTEDQEQELAALLAGEAGVAAGAYEHLVAEMSAALLDDVGTEELPATIADAIVDGATGVVAGVTLISSARSAPSNSWVAIGGWIAAAAALIGWFVLPGAFTDTTTAGSPTLAEMRDSLVSGGAQVVQIPWTATEDPAAAAASGDVVWSTSLQTGFMRFAGLETNDPTVFQYQLWIFDETRDERFPVDGGVFDVGPDGEVIVQIDPKVEVRDPALFAITIEQPGGVVVSDRERIVLIAQAD
ncbi:MAG: anti-sigma factor [Gemmatimonadota bacterium]|nr:anti-sigma factor [Gemmatimonadota bacterium]